MDKGTVLFEVNPKYQTDCKILKFENILGFGIVGIMQVGMSLKSHDQTQRANGVMTLAGGAVITFAKEI